MSAGPPPRSSPASDASDAISVALRDVETDENGGKALCNVNYNSPKAVTFLSPPFIPTENHWFQPDKEEF